MEVKTGPCAPAGCGQPRLAGCNGPVLAVEWDPPMYDGGANLVAYRVWVRPFSATDADPSDLASQVFSETFFFGEDISNPENPSTWHHLQRSS